MSKFSKTVSLEEATIVDVVSSSLIYIGKAIPASPKSSPVWSIAKLVIDAGGGLTKTYADASNYTQIWDNRTSLTYL